MALALGTKIGQWTEYMGWRKSKIQIRTKSVCYFHIMVLPPQKLVGCLVNFILNRCFFHWWNWQFLQFRAVSSRSLSNTMLMWESVYMYIDQTGSTIMEHCMEHSRYIRLNQPATSGLAEHCFTSGHDACFDQTIALFRKNRLLGEWSLRQF